MESAEKQRLMEWMKAAIDLETEIATQESVLNAFWEQHLRKKPKLDLVQTPSEPKRPRHMENPARFGRYDYNAKGIWIAVAIGCFFVAVVILLFGTSAASNAVNRDEVLPGIYISTVVITIIGIICLIPVFVSNHKTNKANAELDKFYAHAMEEYKKNVSTTRAENIHREAVFRRNSQLWKDNEQANTDVLNRELQKSKVLLEQLYSQQVVYQKYCTLPALTSIYEYFITGRCEELAGPYGAYNMYEDELRKDIVISQLNVVIEHLERIKQNQYMLYQQVKLIQQDTERIDYELQQIKGLTFNIAQLSALNTYYAAITARNTEISATFHLLNG